MDEKQEKKGFTQKLPIAIRPITRDDFDSLISSYRQQRILWLTKKSIQGHDIHLYLKKLKDKDEVTGSILEALNNKLDQILAFLKINANEGENFIQQTVYLNSDSIVFKYGEHLKRESLVEIKLKIDADIITCFGNVFKTEQKDGEFIIAAKFIWIIDEDQDRLIEYLFRQEILSEKFKRGLKNID